MIDYILKPFSREEIQQTVLKIIEALQHKEVENRYFSSMMKRKRRCVLLIGYEISDRLLMGYTDDIHSAISSQNYRL